LQGFLLNRVVWKWFFVWLDVVGCVVNVVLTHHTFWPLKIRQIFGIFFAACCLAVVLSHLATGGGSIG
jgi:hypothetical protein